MRKLDAFLALAAIVLLTACQTKQAKPGADVKNITIKSTELGRQTLFRITCESFDKYFPKAMVMKLDKHSMIDSVMIPLTNMKAIDNDQEPDVRGEIYITHTDNKVDTVCLGTTVLKYKQGTYETPQELLAFIQKFQSLMQK